jgi:hypothetical protein
MPKKNQPDESYETTDLIIASFLISEGHSTLRGIRSEGRKRYFVLSPIPDPEIIADFVNDKVKVRPARLFDMRRRLVIAMQTGTPCPAQQT